MTINYYIIRPRYAPQSHTFEYVKAHTMQQVSDFIRNNADYVNCVRDFQGLSLPVGARCVDLTHHIIDGTPKDFVFRCETGPNTGRTVVITAGTLADALEIVDGYPNIYVYVPVKKAGVS
jgi:hypothetical protein